MALNDLIRSCVGIANTITKTVQAEVLLRSWTSNDRYRKPTYDGGMGGRTFTALVEMKQRIILQEGKEVQQVARVTFLEPIPDQGTSGRREPIDPRDKIVLPNGHEGDILWVSGLDNPGTNRPYMLEVGLG